ncbi:MAG: N-acetylneuraminate synthase [Desulfuromonadaceae bacterium]|nr:N-acetylneuraminate synthase [Desulfuromonadaceae bacterium]
MQPVFIIAEAGVNHNGDLELAKQLVDVAAEAGADAVKFQTFKAENLVCQNAPKAAYQQQTTAAKESQFTMIKKLELDLSAHQLLLTHCLNRGIQFLSSPFDLESIDLLLGLGIEIFKIPSGEITNLPYLRKIGSLNKKVILSTGMSTMKEIEAAIQVLFTAGLKKAQLTILHCNTEYPTSMADVNLRAMQTLADNFDIKVGYSDHTLGIEIPIAAVALGAKVIEKHITLDNNLPGPDHRASLEPQELVEMISAIRNLEQAMGNGIKKPTLSEMKNRPIARKSIVARRQIKQGELFSNDNLTVKRPATGISPMEWDRVVGTPASKDFQGDEAIIL